MKILALETGGTATPNEAVLAALELSNSDAQVAALVAIEEPRALGAGLVGAIDEALQTAEWNLEDLDGLAIGSGPGSWTSLRVGFATFKTLAQTRELPLVSVPSFDALASAIHRARPAPQTAGKRGKSKKKRAVAPEPQIVLALSPCRPGALYGKLFQMTEDYLAPVQSEWIASAQTHLDSAFCQGLASEVYGPILICGAAGMQAVELLEARGESDLYEYIEAPAATVAIEIAINGAYQIADDEVPNLNELEPLYLAPSNAERNLKF